MTASHPAQAFYVCLHSLSLTYSHKSMSTSTQRPGFGGFLTKCSDYGPPRPKTTPQIPLISLCGLTTLNAERCQSMVQLLNKKLSNL